MVVQINEVKHLKTLQKRQTTEVMEHLNASTYSTTQVDSGATVCSLFVQSIAGSDEMTDISNVDTNLQRCNTL